MEDEKIMKQAKTVYETVCRMLEARDWHFTRHDEELKITCGVRGDDLPMDIIILVNPRAQVVSLYSPMPFNMSEDKKFEAALAVCAANYGFVNGTFDYDLSDGEIRFRIVSSFRESILSEEVFNYMLAVAVSTIDEYNDKFFMISKGLMSVEQFIEWNEERRGS